MSGVLLLSLLAAPAAAHMALWHPSGFGFEKGNWDANDIVNPLFHLRKDEWFFHGKKDQPPDDGVFAYLPAGDKFHAEISCNKHFTSWGNTNEAGYANLQFACDNKAMIHSGADDYDSKELKDVKGCGIAIAYESDQYKVQPEDFVVISTNYQCPFLKAVDFAIPEGLPACPPGGCLCTFNWIHSGFGGRPEMIHNAFRCQVTGKTGTKPLAKPVVARKCPFDRNNCTVGAKMPFVWAQDEGSNVLQDERDPPFYNWEYGFADGAQMDIWQTDDSPMNTEWAPHPFATGKGNDPKETPATKPGVPPAVRTPMPVTKAPFTFRPGLFLEQDTQTPSLGGPGAAAATPSASPSPTKDAGFIEAVAIPTNKAPVDGAPASTPVASSGPAIIPPGPTASVSTPQSSPGPLPTDGTSAPVASPSASVAGSSAAGLSAIDGATTPVTGPSATDATSAPVSGISGTSSAPGSKGTKKCHRHKKRRLSHH